MVIIFGNRVSGERVIRLVEKGIWVNGSLIVSINSLFRINLDIVVG